MDRSSIKTEDAITRAYGIETGTAYDIFVDDILRLYEIEGQASEQASEQAQSEVKAINANIANTREYLASLHNKLVASSLYREAIKYSAYILKSNDEIDRFMEEQAKEASETEGQETEAKAEYSLSDLKRAFLDDSENLNYAYELDGIIYLSFSGYKPSLEQMEKLQSEGTISYQKEGQIYANTEAYKATVELAKCEGMKRAKKAKPLAYAIHKLNMDGLPFEQCEAAYKEKAGAIQDILSRKSQEPTSRYCLRGIRQ